MEGGVVSVFSGLRLCTCFERGGAKGSVGLRGSSYSFSILDGKVATILVETWE